MALLLSPHPEGSNDGRDLRARAGVPHRPCVDHLAEILRRDLERLPIGKQEAHPRKHRLVVADRRIGRAVLVAEPAQVAADELTERRLPVRLVLHRLSDDPGGLAERQARVHAIRAVRPVTRDVRVAQGALRRGHGFVEERELATRNQLGRRFLGSDFHPRRLPGRPRQLLAINLPRAGTPSSERDQVRARACPLRRALTGAGTPGAVTSESHHGLPNRQIAAQRVDPASATLTSPRISLSTPIA